MQGLRDLGFQGLRFFYSFLTTWGGLRGANGLLIGQVGGTLVKCLNINGKIFLHRFLLGFIVI